MARRRAQPALPVELLGLPQLSLGLGKALGNGGRQAGNSCCFLLKAVNFAVEELKVVGHGQLRAVDDGVGMCTGEGPANPGICTLSS